MRTVPDQPFETVSRSRLASCSRSRAIAGLGDRHGCSLDRRPRWRQPELRRQRQIRWFARPGPWHELVPRAHDLLQASECAGRREVHKNVWLRFSLASSPLLNRPIHLILDPLAQSSLRFASLHFTSLDISSSHHITSHQHSSTGHHTTPLNTTHNSYYSTSHHVFHFPLPFP